MQILQYLQDLLSNPDYLHYYNFKRKQIITLDYLFYMIIRSKVCRCMFRNKDSKSEENISLAEFHVLIGNSGTIPANISH